LSKKHSNSKQPYLTSLIPKFNWSRESSQGRFNKVFYSFPIQLVFILFKKNIILLLYWLILLGIITESIAGKWGIPYLFLDPEYMGVVGFASLFLLGCTFGGFIMAFNMASYILNGFRFPFLATLSRPFLKYVLNNSIVPTLFILVYLYKFVDFQLNGESEPIAQLLLQLSGFLFGLIGVIMVSIVYFNRTNNDLFKIRGINRSEDIYGNQPVVEFKNRSVHKAQKIWRVETYISRVFRVKIVRGTGHYEKEIVRSVFKQNHLNAARIELLVFTLFILMGLFREYQYLRIPAGASVVILFSLFIMLMSAMRFMLRGWANSVFIILFLLINLISQIEWLNPSNKAYGLNYLGKKAPYNSIELYRKINTDTIKHDIDYTINILNNWKKRVSKDGKKPKLIFINASGGGERAAAWTYRVMQAADSVTNNLAFSHTQLITGASGGMIGAAYYRELMLENNVDCAKYDKYVNISKDLLNPIAFSISVNDLFLRMQKLHDGNYKYTKDRAYAFELQLNENLNNVFTGKRLSYYTKPEAAAIIPMMIFTPSIINDGRRLFVASQPISYLTYKSTGNNFEYFPVIEGIEFNRFFNKQDSWNLRFTSALRMSATFPYVMPNVSLPSEPAIQVMDAGLRDNFGVLTSVKFLYTFREWIKENTSGVIFIQIRDTPKEPKIERNVGRTLIENLTTPIESVYGNFAKVQLYNNDSYFEYASAWYDGPFHFITFELSNEKQKVSLSWHLTRKEKEYIYKAIEINKNQEALHELKLLLK
jgi:hypothetical protein